jgi:hypothetical protein
MDIDAMEAESPWKTWMTQFASSNTLNTPLVRGRTYSLVVPDEKSNIEASYQAPMQVMPSVNTNADGPVPSMLWSQSLLLAAESPVVINQPLPVIHPVVFSPEISDGLIVDEDHSLPAEQKPKRRRRPKVSVTDEEEALHPLISKPPPRRSKRNSKEQDKAVEVTPEEEKVEHAQKEQHQEDRERELEGEGERKRQRQDHSLEDEDDLDLVLMEDQSHFHELDLLSHAARLVSSSMEQRDAEDRMGMEVLEDVDGNLVFDMRKFIGIEDQQSLTFEIPDLPLLGLLAEGSTSTARYKSICRRIEEAHINEDMQEMYRCTQALVADASFSLEKVNADIPVTNLHSSYAAFKEFSVCWGLSHRDEEGDLCLSLGESSNAQDSIGPSSSSGKKTDSSSSTTKRKRHRKGQGSTSRNISNVVNEAQEDNTRAEPLSQINLDLNRLRLFQSVKRHPQCPRFTFATTQKRWQGKNICTACKTNFHKRSIKSFAQRVETSYSSYGRLNHRQLCVDELVAQYAFLEKECKELETALEKDSPSSPSDSELSDVELNARVTEHVNEVFRNIGTHVSDIGLFADDSLMEPVLTEVDDTLEY